MSDGAAKVLTPRHHLLVWLIGVGILGAAFFLTVVALNSTVFSSASFVSGYLSAIQRHDLDEVLATAGVETDPGARTNLLRADLLTSLENISLVADRDEGEGTHRVTFEYEIDDSTLRSTFLVKSTGTTFGLFSSWKFQESPLGTLIITPLHDPRFSVNGIEVDSKAGADAPVPYQVVVPGRYELSHDSTYLFANPRPEFITKPGATDEAVVSILPKQSFVQAVQRQVNSFLDDCATQTVLFPTGCPFGQALDNRVLGSPKWSIVSYPKVKLLPGETSGEWEIPAAEGTAHLKMQVQSLFDGSVSTFDEDIPFKLSWKVRISGNQVLFEIEDL